MVVFPLVFVDNPQNLLFFRKGANSRKKSETESLPPVLHIRIRVTRIRSGSSLAFEYGSVFCYGYSTLHLFGV